jgi:hypothetical protein
MNGLAKFLVDSILNEDENALGSVALFGGGFKPPTKGHLDVVLQGLRDNPEVKQVYILVGSGVRNGVTQEEAVKIWKMYKKFIPVSTQIVAVQSPFSYIKTYLQDHQDENVYIFIGARPDNDEDEKDVAERSAYAKKYSEKAFPVKVTTPGNVSGTQARAAAITSKEDFLQFIPSKLTDSEKESIYQMVADVVKEKINENASYSSDINVKEKILELTKHMLAKGMNIKPLPKVKFVNGDSNNAREFLGKTAYYDPNNFTITLYTEGRHPKDIVRSFSHEMIHHIQNLEDRLGDVSTTNTMEDDNIDKLEQEANLKGTMTFRNWTDSLNEGINEYNNSGPTTPKVYIVKDDGTYKEAPIELLSKISNLTYDMGGGETNFYPSKNIVIVDNIPVEEFAKSPGEIKGEKIYVEYNLNNPTSLPKANKIIASQLVYHLDNREAFAQTVANSLKDGGTFEFNSDLMNQKDKMFLQHLSDEYGFGLPSNLNQYKSDSLPLKKGEFVEPVISYIYKITDKDGKTAKLSVTKKGNGWEYKKIDGDIDFKTGGFSTPPVDPDPDFRDKKYTLRTFDKYLSFFGDSNTIVDFEELNEANKPYKHKHGFDDKLGKDPFGLNQYARELAKGLEEAIVMEGRYDSLVRQLASITLNSWKDDSKGGEKNGYFTDEITPENYPTDLNFVFKASAQFTDNKPYNHNGYSRPDGEVGVKYIIPKDMVPQGWEEIYMDLVSTIRHEIEHQTQSGKNVKDGKGMESDAILRKLIKTGGDVVRYVTLPKEVDANVNGLYLKAKKWKRPYAEVVDEYIKDFIGIDNPADASYIKNIFAKRAKELNLPNILTEGRYDKSTNQFSNIVFDMFKEHPR